MAALYDPAACRIRYGGEALADTILFLPPGDSRRAGFSASAELLILCYVFINQSINQFICIRPHGSISQ